MNNVITFISIYMISSSLAVYAMIPEDNAMQQLKRVSCFALLETQPSTSKITQTPEDKHNSSDYWGDCSYREASLAKRSVTPNRLDFIRKSNPEITPSDDLRSQSYSYSTQYYKKHSFLDDAAQSSTESTSTSSLSTPRNQSGCSSYRYSWESDSNDPIYE
ncbi:MAG: hypothetical protein M1114_01790 [Candidatus Dependentiae bacterium]|nr:hypothetical protein [Candidatus Dependentiae bacterium]